jgi:hypothetical protein
MLLLSPRFFLLLSLFAYCNCTSTASK